MDQPRTSAADTVVSAGGVVLHSDGGLWYIALVRRHDGDWVLPKGHLIGNETLIEAALREIGEETGIRPSELEISDYLGAFPFQDFGGDRRKKLNHFVLMFYKGPRGKKLTTDADHSKAAWHPFPVEAADLRYDYQKELLSKVADTYLMKAKKADQRAGKYARKAGNR